MKRKFATFVLCSVLPVLLYHFAKPEPGRLIDLNDIPNNVICETVARDSSWYIITVPVSGTPGLRSAFGVYYFGKRLPQYFIKTKDGIQAVESEDSPRPIEWPDDPHIRILP